MKSIIAFGDSVLQGVISVNNQDGFDITEQDSLNIATKSLGIDFINKSVYGSTLDKTLHRLERCIQKGITSDVAIIESGDNDCDYDWDGVLQGITKNQRLPLNDFCALLEKAVLLCRQNKITPLFMTLVPLVAENWFKHICARRNERAILDFIGGNVQSLYKNQELYSCAIENVARKCGVQLVDMRREFLKRADYKTLMCQDGIHPNVEGYCFMAIVWEKELKRVKLEF